MTDALEPTRMPDGEIKMMAQKPQAPSLGRIVLFTPGVPEGERHNGAKEYPAIIGQVFSDPTNPRPYCNLFVMPPFTTPYWEGSTLEALPDELGAARTWRWPPRV